METPKISICILTYNRAGNLNELLTSLDSINKAAVEIIVVDNNSTDDTSAIVKKFPFVRYHKTEKNIGVSARNIGIKNAVGEIVVTIDDDILGLNDESLTKIYELFIANKMLGALNFKVIDYRTGKVCNWIHHCKSEEFENKFFSTYEITEGAVAFRKSIFKEVGYYSEDLFLSHEGLDLAFRIMDSGLEVKYTGEICLKHCHAESGRKPWYRYYYDTRNQFWVAAKNLPLKYSIKYLSRGLLSTMVYSIRDFQVKYWAQGVFDGITGIRKSLNSRKKITDSTMQIIEKIDQNRPPVYYMAMKRLFRKEMRL